MQGQAVRIPTGDAALSAIDTGTTLIGGPSSAVNAIYGAIDGAQPLGGQMEGFWAFREYSQIARSYSRLTVNCSCVRSVRHRGRHCDGVRRQALAH